MSAQYQQNKSSQPTSQQQASTNYKEAFQLFDKRGTGRVPRDSLGDLLRACGQNPTLAEIADLEKSLGSSECVLSPIPQKNTIPHQDVAAATKANEMSQLTLTPSHASSTVPAASAILMTLRTTVAAFRCSIRI
jgi:hypothetical protein